LKSIRRLARVFVAVEIAACLWTACSFSAIERQVANWRQARPPFTQADLQVAGIAATFEAQVLPEPLRSQAYRAIVWTMRNRVASGYDGTTGYSDEQLLDEYTAFRDHRDDAPDPLAVASAGQVLAALTNNDDPTKGARHYVDNSYWTGTHEQTGAVHKFRGKFSDADVQRLVDEGRFTLVIEWKSSLGHPLGPLFYGLYFFDTWPPPIPVSTPTLTATPFPLTTGTFERRASASVPSIVRATVTPTAAAR
jgi:hypothetical protein